MKKSLSIKQVLLQSVPTFDLSEEWRLMLGEPQTTGSWIIWGRSGSGKSSFVLRLAKELSRFGVVLYNSLEEGFGKSFMNSLERFGMMDVNGRVQVISEDMAALSQRLKKRKSPRIVIIDSFQYTGMSYREYLELKAANRSKLLIFVSHASGNNPAGKAAISVMYDSDEKIWVEGYRAFSKGRFLGERGWFDIWPEKSEMYWGK
ncbi:MAG: AAA family ATPase [Porphyromonas sp.]|nr:AAA family ATPase [Bacteroidales bacterium]MDD7559320.1 AAA family ATPase [Bacteroidales bacterium]MDY3101473.1 AAA family ATPase [Porphyromonas sp.]